MQGIRKADREKREVKDADKLIIVYNPESEWAKRVAQGILRELGLSS